MSTATAAQVAYAIKLRDTIREHLADEAASGELAKHSYGRLEDLATRTLLQLTYKRPAPGPLAMRPYAVDDAEDRIYATTAALVARRAAIAAMSDDEIAALDKDVVSRLIDEAQILR